MSEQAVLEKAFQQALHYLQDCDKAGVGATATLAQLRQRLTRPLQHDNTPATQVLDDLVADTRGGIIGSTGGRFFGWVIGGALPAALGADWLISTWDQNAALFACGPAVAVIEEVAGAWLKQLLALPQQASFAFVSGCQMAHVTCLAAARHALLKRRGWDVETQGLAGAPRIRILASERHGSIDRAVRLLGMGTHSLEMVAANDSGHKDARGLQRALEQDDLLTIVLLQAGDINTGRFDDFTTVIPLAHKWNAWVHVDGAFGLWAGASPSYRRLAQGVDAADSWATDGHKWLNVPYDSGYAFVADEGAHRAAMSHRASYLTHDDDARDQIDWNPEWSRRARGVATYAALRQLGTQGVADLVDRCCRLATALTTSLAALPGAELVCAPVLNQGLVRFGSDEMTDGVVTAVADSGEAFFTATTWHGKRCMRISVCNWRTSDQDVTRATGAVERVLFSLGTAEGARIKD